MTLVATEVKTIKLPKVLVALEVIGHERSNYKGTSIELTVKNWTSGNIHTEAKPSLAIDPVSAVERRNKKIIWNRGTGTRSYAPAREYNNFIIKSEVWKDPATGELTRKERK